MRIPAEHEAGLAATILLGGENIHDQIIIQGMAELGPAPARREGVADTRLVEQGHVRRKMGQRTAPSHFNLTVPETVAHLEGGLRVIPIGRRRVFCQAGLRPAEGDISGLDPVRGPGGPVGAATEIRQSRAERVTGQARSQRIRVKTESTLIPILKNQTIERAGIGRPVAECAATGRQRFHKTDLFHAEIQVLLPLGTEGFLEVHDPHTGNTVGAGTGNLAGNQVGGRVHIVSRGIQQDLQRNFRLRPQVREGVEQQGQRTSYIRSCKGGARNTVIVAVAIGVIGRIARKRDVIIRAC